MRSRRRGLALAALAIVSAALSASLVSRRAREVSAQVGPLQKVYVAKREIPEKTILSAANADRLLDTRLVAKRYLPRQYYDQPRQVLGLTTRVKVPAGTYLSPGQLGSGTSAPAPEVEPGQRTVDVTVPTSRALASLLGPGSRVDVLITVEDGDRPGKTSLAYQDVEVLAVGEATGAGAGSADADRDTQLVVTLRVSLRQAVALTAAQSFAKQITVLPRPERDRRRIGPVVASGGSF